MRNPPHVTKRIPAVFGDRIALIGADLPFRSIEAGSTLSVRYVFKCLKTPKPGDNLFVHLLHEGEFINADHIPVSGTYPPEQWKPGEYIIDEHKIHVPKNWHGGEVRLAIGFWNKRDGKRLTITGTDAEVADRRLVIAEAPLKSPASRRSAFF